MSRNAPADLLVCYDIHEPKRLQRIHREMCAWGVRLQYSVFYCRLRPKERRRLERCLQDLIDPRNDDVRIYGIQPFENIHFIGQRPWPEGVGCFFSASVGPI